MVTWNLKKNVRLKKDVKFSIANSTSIETVTMKTNI